MHWIYNSAQNKWTIKIGKITKHKKKKDRLLKLGPTSLSSSWFYYSTYAPLLMFKKTLPFFFARSSIPPPFPPSFSPLVLCSFSNNCQTLDFSGLFPFFFFFCSCGKIPRSLSLNLLYSSSTCQIFIVGAAAAIDDVVVSRFLNLFIEGFVQAHNPWEKKNRETIKSQISDTTQRKGKYRKSRRRGKQGGEGLAG